MDVSQEFMRVIKAACWAIACIAIVLLAVAAGHAQNAGTVGIQAEMTPVFSAKTATYCSPIVNDIGQGSNILFIAQTAAGGGTAVFDLEWSPTGVTPFYPITEALYADSAATTHRLIVDGYFPNLRSCLVTYTSGTWSGWYTDISGPLSFAAPAIGTNGPTSPPLCDQTSQSALASAATAPVGPLPVINASDTVIVCSIVVSFQAAATTGDLAFIWATSGACTGHLVGGTDPYTTASTPQTYVLNSKIYSVVITSGIYAGIYNAFCLTNNSGTGVHVNVNWGSIHGL